MITQEHERWMGGRGSAGTARTRVQKDTLKGLDHPDWKQMTHRDSKRADKRYKETDGRSLRRNKVRSYKTCRRTARGMRSQNTACSTYK